MPLHYVGGVWVALVSALGFMAFYAFRVAEEARLLADALAATELVLQREQHLSALDGLAAAAAHELGTPLATIALVAHELASELKPDDPHAEDIRLIRAQSERCREILSKIASLSSDPDEHLGLMPLSHVLEEAVAPHRDFGIAISIERKGEAPEPVAGRNPGPALRARQPRRQRRRLRQVGGPHPGGMVGDGRDDHHRRRRPGLLARRDRPARRALRHHAPRRPAVAGAQEHGGLGLGIFIAKTLLERSGAKLRLANRKPPETGASVTIAWPRAAFEAAAPQALAKHGGAADKSLIGGA